MDYQDKNGKIHRFPDGTSQAIVAKAMGPLYVEPKKSDDDIMSTLGNLAKGSKDIYESLVKPEHIVKAGLMGLGKAGQNIGELAAPIRKYIPESMKFAEKPNFDLPENANMVEKVAHGAGQYAPMLAAGPMGLIPDTLAGAAYGATQSPEDKLTGAEVGGASNAGFNVLGKMLQNQNPIVKLASRALLGGGAGYAEGGPQGAIEGASLTTLGPKILKKMGVIGDPSKEIMSRIAPHEAMERAEAGSRLGTPLTPGEASARPDITAMESGIGRTSEAAAERVKIGQQRIAEQKAAIDNLNKTITPSTKIASFNVRKAAQDSIAKMEDARQEAVKPFYEAAYEKKVAPNLITGLENSDANIRMAIKDAMEDPKYQVPGELLDDKSVPGEIIPVPKNSIKVLDYAKRKLDSKIEQAKNFGDNDAVRVLSASKDKLLKKIEGFSPDYKVARDEYSKLSKPIEEVENSQVGQIAKMKDTGLKNVSKNIFDPSQTDINVLKKIKDHVQQENPGAWDSIVKNELNRLMTQGKNNGITGRSFFDRVLSNDNRFKQFQVALEHNPKALSQLNDMKTAWEHLINLETPRTAAGQAKTNMSFARNSVDAIINMYNNLTGGEKHIKALKYLYSDKWLNDLGKIKLMPKKDQKPMMVMLLGKTIVPAYKSESDRQGG